MAARPAAFVAVVLVASAASGQRRDDASAEAKLEVTIDKPLRFGEQALPARRYRVTIADGRLSFADASTMVTAASVAAVESASKKWVSPAQIEVKKKGKNQLEVIVRSGDRVYVATGTIGAAEAGYQPTLAKGDAALDLGTGPAQQSDQDLVNNALKRYIADVRHCGDKAVKSSWKTDDARYAKCVCPLAMKWRMPKVSAALRMHHELTKGKAGMSFTVAPDGKVTSCRAWVGTQPPADESGGGLALDAPAIDPSAAGATPAPVPTPAPEVTP